MAVIERYHPATHDSLCAKVSQVLRQGGLVAVPTETYYGLGANPFDPAAVQRLVAAKGRSDGKPILLLIGAREQLGGLVTQIPPPATVLIETFWPGPLTIVFPAQTGFPEPITAGTGTVGVRWTSSRELAAILQKVGPLTGTSANRSEQPPARTALEIQQAFGDAVDVIIDAGTTPGGLPSTVVQVHPTVRLLREGAITSAAISEALRARGFSLNSSEI